MTNTWSGTRTSHTSPPGLCQSSLLWALRPDSSALSYERPGGNSADPSGALTLQPWAQRSAWVRPLSAALFARKEHREVEKENECTDVST